MIAHTLLKHATCPQTHNVQSVQAAFNLSKMHSHVWRRGETIHVGNVCPTYAWTQTHTVMLAHTMLQVMCEMCVPQTDAHRHTQT